MRSRVWSRWWTTSQQRFVPTPADIDALATLPTPTPASTIPAAGAGPRVVAAGVAVGSGVTRGSPPPPRLPPSAADARFPPFREEPRYLSPRQAGAAATVSAQ